MRAMSRAVVAILLLFSVLRCGMGADGSGESEDVHVITVEVVGVAYGELAEQVDLTLLEQTMIEGEFAVPLELIVLAAGITTPLADLVFDFESVDGNRPYTDPTCSAFVPVEGGRLPQGYLSLETGSLLWRDVGEASGCLSVVDVAWIHVFDAQSVGSVVTVEEGNHSTPVDLRFLPQSRVNQRSVVSMDSIVRSAMGSPEIYLFELVAWDGFNPADAGQLGPLEYSGMESLWVDLLTRQVSRKGQSPVDPLWEIQRLTRILCAPAATSAGSVMVEDDTGEQELRQEVELGPLARTEYNHESLVLLSEVINKSGIIENAGDKFYTLTSSSGFDPFLTFNEALAYPELLSGYIHPVSRNVQLDPNTGRRAYWNLRDTAILRVVEDPG